MQWWRRTRLLRGSLSLPSLTPCRTHGAVLLDVVDSAADFAHMTAAAVPWAGATLVTVAHGLPDGSIRRRGLAARLRLLLATLVLTLALTLLALVLVLALLLAAARGLRGGVRGPEWSGAEGDLRDAPAAWPPGLQHAQRRRRPLPTLD